MKDGIDSLLPKGKGLKIHHLFGFNSAGADAFPIMSLIIRQGILNRKRLDLEEMTGKACGICNKCKEAFVFDDMYYSRYLGGSVCKTCWDE